MDILIFITCVVYTLSLCGFFVASDRFIPKHFENARRRTSDASTNSTVEYGSDRGCDVQQPCSSKSDGYINNAAVSHPSLQYWNGHHRVFLIVQAAWWFCVPDHRCVVVAD